ncbi:unnamed protein product [Prorocentrum cordatum]|uniref:Ion transport domain-containing protein n=1 Tax=Prorocentrum cordatum TaxID=2364126 RepID=A0ABN9TMN8_9DINO|nr:unnamed protein product [Polarella glacialis]
MKVVDFDGQDLEPGSPAARLPASSPEPAAAPRPGSPSGYGSPGPSSPKKAYSVKFTASPAGFASAGAAASLEHAGARSELGEELARRLDKIDSKLDWLVSRSRATGTADIQRTRSTGSAHGFPAFADADRAAPPAAHAETPYSAADSGPRTSVTALRSATDGGGPLTSVTALRGVADVGPLISVEPPSAVGSAPSPRGPRPHLMVQRRMSSQEDRRRQAGGRAAPPELGAPASGVEGGVRGQGARVAGGHAQGLEGLAQGVSAHPQPEHLEPEERHPRADGDEVDGVDGLWSVGVGPVVERERPRHVQEPVRGQEDVREVRKQGPRPHAEGTMADIQTLPTAMTKRRSKAVDYVWTVLDDPGSSSVAWWTAMLLQILVLLSVLGTFLQTVEEPPLRGWSAAIVELVFDAVFLLEICIRWCSAPSKVNFAFATHTWIDIAAASAIAVRAAVGFVLPESQDDAGLADFLVVLCADHQIIEDSPALRDLQRAHPGGQDYNGGPPNASLCCGLDYDDVRHPHLSCGAGALRIAVSGSLVLLGDRHHSWLRGLCSHDYGRNHDRYDFDRVGGHTDGGAYRYYWKHI